jgi:hypothetical protein
MSIQEAVDDIIAQGVSELRKRAFGDDAEDAKNLPWSREQAWILMKQLAKKPEVSGQFVVHAVDANASGSLQTRFLIMKCSWTSRSKGMRHL